MSGGERERSEMDGLDRAWSQLMAKAQSGDQSAYADLLAQILPVLRAVARRPHHALASQKEKAGHERPAFLNALFYPKFRKRRPFWQSMCN